jgi:hypothetical protein
MMTARYLGPSNFGVINYAASIVAFVLPVMQLGINSVLVQELVKNPEEEGKTVDIEVTAHGATSTKHFYKEVKFGTYTLTIDAEAKGYKTADGKTEKALFADDAAAKAWKEAVVAGNVEVNGVKTIMTNDKLCKDKNGYGGTNFDWKGNRDKTVAAFIEHGKALENATYNADAKKWSLNDVELGATWTDLNTRKEGSLSYVELLVKALNAVK